MNRRRFFSMLWIIGLVPICLIAWRWTVLLVGTKLEIASDTTFVTGPLTADGQIDYPAAIHQRNSRGVTPENNAAVLIDQAFGVSTIAPDLRAQYFQWLGIDPLPEQGDYVVTHASIVHQKAQGKDSPAELQEALFAEFLRAQSRPWARADCPAVAEWLDANSRPLELIQQASRRSQYYSPQVTKDGMLQAQSTLQNTRESVRLLTTRAMLRLAEDDVPGAWSDLLTCHRLAARGERHFFVKSVGSWRASHVGSAIG